ncbi:unnamed protein product [Aphanomyces euteiches]
MVKVEGDASRENVDSDSQFQEQGTRVLEKYLLKKDRVPGLHKLDTPNGDIDGFTKVVWVNIREEAVIFVEGIPFTARPSSKLNENDMVPDITGNSIAVLEASLKDSLLEQLSRSESKLEYWHEPTLLCNELVTQLVDPKQVKTLHEVMADIQHPGIESVIFQRATIERGNFPEHQIVDQLIEWISKADLNTAVVFNCQKGRCRTTTVMTLAYLIWSAPLQLSMSVSEQPFAKLMQAASMDSQTMDYKLGRYKVNLSSYLEYFTM